MTVAIDGPAGVGKSTIASMVAKEKNFYNLNSGNFYRTVTYRVVQDKLDPENEENVIAASENMNIEVIDGELHLEGVNIENQLHSDTIDKYVAQHSAIVKVRENVNIILRKLTENLDIVAEGRDMTTVVFPEAEVKVFLDASVEERASRRFNQGVSSLTFKEICDGIQSRDEIDRNKPVGSLKIAEDALYIDTTGLTIMQVCEKVLSEIDKKI
jgi:cytidylate kinase